MQSQPPIDNNHAATFNDTPSAVPPIVPAPVLTPNAVLPAVQPVPPAPTTIMPPILQPGNNWLAATDLVVGGDNRLQQSAQSPEISKYVSKTVRVASLKIFFVDAFPDPEKQTEWLSESLASVLQDQARTDRVAYKVNLRAQQDNQYVNALISMVRRWHSSSLLLALFLSQVRQRADGAMPASP